MSDKKVLIAGGAGFIGRHLCADVLGRGADVIILDDFSTGSRAALQTLTPSERVSILEADVAAPLPDVPRCDLVFNLASPASPPIYQRDPVKTWRTNIYGTDQLAKLALEWGAGFVQASTSEVYGDPQVHPQPETYWGHVNPVGVRACYDEGKRAAETLIMDMVRHHGLNGRITRIFNTYGPGMNRTDGRLLPNLIAQALRGDPLTIYGDGTQTRSLCYVDDLVEGLIRLALVEDVRGEVVNLGNTSEDSINTIARRVAEACGVTLRTVHRDLPKDDPTRRCPDISKAHRLLGWAPKTALGDGLSRMIDSFRDGD